MHDECCPAKFIANENLVSRKQNVTYTHEKLFAFSFREIMEAAEYQGAR